VLAGVGGSAVGASADCGVAVVDVATGSGGVAAGGGATVG
jgi:hypothetical protein